MHSPVEQPITTRNASSSHTQFVSCSIHVRQQHAAVHPHHIQQGCRSKQLRRHASNIPRFTRSAASDRSHAADASSQTVAGQAPALQPGKSAFIFGLGYVGIGLAATLRRHGWHVGGTCRDEEACRGFRSEGVDAHILDSDNSAYLSAAGERALAAASHIVTTVPPVGDFDRDPVLENCEKRLIEAAPRLRWLGYVSSTGVYGDHKGAWVDERSATLADAGKPLARLQAELAWRKLAAQHGLPLHVFRLGGIYGPKRSALDAAAQQVETPSQQRRGQQRFTARCHVHDICTVLLASVQRPSPGAIYNIVDDEPAPRSEVVAFARQLLHGAQTDAQTTPPVDRPAAGAAVSQQLAEKRVSNEKIKEQLGIQLAFPTFREGLRAIHSGNLTPFL